MNVSPLPLFPRPTLAERLRRWRCRYVPHKTRSGNCWCLPLPWVYLFGGTYDTGNGYGWRPPLHWRRLRESIRCRRARLLNWWHLRGWKKRLKLYI